MKPPLKISVVGKSTVHIPLVQNREESQEGSDRLYHEREADAVCAVAVWSKPVNVLPCVHFEWYSTQWALVRGLERSLGVCYTTYVRAARSTYAMCTLWAAGLLIDSGKWSRRLYVAELALVSLEFRGCVLGSLTL